MTPQEIMAIASRVVDCEWAAAGRFDHGQSIADLAEQIMGVCSVERIKARQAVGLSLHDPQMETDDLAQAVRVAEDARKQRGAVKR